MRWVICTLAVLALAPRAFAADLDGDYLRGAQPVGPATYTRWSGFYFGGQFSYSDATADFSKATQSLVAFSLRNLALEDEQHPSQWQTLGKGNDAAIGYGGFVGYNTQWQDVIIGLEGNYTHTALATTASASPISRVVSAGGNVYNVTSTATGTLEMTDYGSLRARAGWILGNVLPYGFAGLAVGHADFAVTTRVFGQQNSASPAVFPCDPTQPTCVNFDFSNSVGQNGAFLFGLSIGGGLDWAVSKNFFLRGEFEYIDFASFNNVAVSIISARAGAGFKF